MRKLTNEDVPNLEKKVGKLSVELAYGTIKNAQELAKRVEKEFKTSEDRVFALTLLIINRYNEVSDKVINDVVDEEVNKTMFG